MLYFLLIICQLHKIILQGLSSVFVWEDCFESCKRLKQTKMIPPNLFRQSRDLYRVKFKTTHGVEDISALY